MRLIKQYIQQRLSNVEFALMHVWAYSPFRSEKKMHTIKFEEPYKKMHGQTIIAKLVHVMKTERKFLNEKFIEYDTTKESGERYILPDTELIHLVFIGQSLIPFSTVRRWTPDKEKYYKSLVGKDLLIEFTGGKK